jgi:hypothetical protein
MATNGHTNGTHAHRSLTQGIYAPIPTFYVAETEDLGQLLQLVLPLLID